MTVIWTGQLLLAWELSSPLLHPAQTAQSMPRLCGCVRPVVPGFLLAGPGDRRAGRKGSKKGNCLFIFHYMTAVS